MIVARNIISGAILAAVMGILQSTFFSYIDIFNAAPDLALLVIIWYAYDCGVMTGQITGFAAGVLLDFLSASPLGFHAFTYTLLGAAGGLLRGAFSMDAFILPMLLAAGGTLAKALLCFFISLLFSGATPHYAIAAPTLWIEMGFNMLCVPFLYALLKIAVKFIRKKDMGLSHA
jgi:rod shape-determining protein MreD